MTCNTAPSYHFIYIPLPFRNNTERIYCKMFSKPLLNEKLVNVITGTATGKNMGKNHGVIGVKNMVIKKKMLPGQVGKSTGNNEMKNAVNTGRQSCKILIVYIGFGDKERHRLR